MKKQPKVHMRPEDVRDREPKPKVFIKIDLEEKMKNLVNMEALDEYTCPPAEIGKAATHYSMLNSAWDVEMLVRDVLEVWMSGSSIEIQEHLNLAEASDKNAKGLEHQKTKFKGTFTYFLIYLNGLGELKGVSASIIFVFLNNSLTKDSFTSKQNDWKN